MAIPSLTTSPRAAATIVAFAAIALASTTTTAQPAAWSTGAPYPNPIANNAVVSVCNGPTCTIYSFMGIVDPTDRTTITAAAFKLTTPGTGPWQPIADAPFLNSRAKIAASAIACDGRIFLVGGYAVAALAEFTEKRLFEYDPVADNYIQRADVPVHVDDTVVACYQDRHIYTVSGWHGPANDNVTDVQVYDTVNDSWQPCTPIPGPGRFGHAGGIVDDRLVIIDGTVVSGVNFVIEHSTLVGAIDPADPTLITWTSGATSPGAPTYRAAASLDTLPCSEILFVGGTDNPYNYNGTGYNGQPANPLDQVMAYDPVADTWRFIDDSGGAPHTPTMDHRGLVLFDNQWTTVGGMTAPGTATTAVNALSIPDDRPDCNSNGLPDVCELLPVCGADTNDDCAVNTDDFLAVLANWGNCTLPCPPTCPADLTDDCAVNTDDFLAVLSNWGPCP